VYIHFRLVHLRSLLRGLSNEIQHNDCNFTYVVLVTKKTKRIAICCLSICPSVRFILVCSISPAVSHFSCRNSTNLRHANQTESDVLVGGGGSSTVIIHQHGVIDHAVFGPARPEHREVFGDGQQEGAECVVLGAVWQPVVALLQRETDSGESINREDDQHPDRRVAAVNTTQQYGITRISSEWRL